MPSLGTSRRLRRLSGLRGRFLLLAVDHGLPAGPIRGMEDLPGLLGTLRGAPFTGVIVNPGMTRHVPEDPVRGLVVHLSAGTLRGSAPTSKVLAGSVQHAISLGADAVSVQIQFGDAAEGRMLSDAGCVVDAATRFGLPVVIMAYPPGALQGTADLDAVCHAARAAAEVGADVVQVPHPGNAERVRAAVRGCPAPVVVAGGPRTPSPEAFLDSVRGALTGGAAGISVGRNVAQHPDPAGFAGRLGAVVFGEAPPASVPEG